MKSAASKAVAANSRQSAAKRRLILLAGAALALAGAGIGVKFWLDLRAASAARTEALAAAEVALTRTTIDGDELSRVMAALKDLPDHEQARDLLAAQARIELARNRADRADQLFGRIASQPGASAAEQGLGARILLRRHEAGYPDASSAVGALQQATQFAEVCYRESGAEQDLFRAWLAADRLGATERTAALAGELSQRHADSASNRYVQLVARFDPQQGVAALDRVLAELVEPPVDAAALRAFALMQGGDLPGAVAAVEAALAQAPGVAWVRWAAAVAFHGCVAGSAEGSEDRARWVARRDPQLDWVLASGPFGEARRAQCEQMRALR